MKVAELTAIGLAEDVVKCREIPEPKDPKEDEITVEIKAAPINPAEILLIEGNYGLDVSPPARLGIEGAGIITAVGTNVKTLSVGDKVMSLGRTNWAQKITDKASTFVKLPQEIDVIQAAMLKVNVATAELMLTKYVELQDGDWVIQNASNSGVGTDLIKIAKVNNIKTVNVVRRDELVAPLMALGADIVVVDDDHLAERIREKIGDVEIKLGIDAIAGSSTNRIAKCLTEGGTVINYGLLSGKPCEIDPFECVFRDIRLVGFWLSKYIKIMQHHEIERLYSRLSEYIIDGTVNVAVDKTYGLEDASKALAHAKKEGRNGKILFRPNP